MVQHLPDAFHCSFKAYHPLAVVCFLLMGDQHLLLVDRFNDMTLRLKSDVVILAKIFANSTHG